MFFDIDAGEGPVCTDCWTPIHNPSQYTYAPPGETVCVECRGLVRSRFRILITG